MIKVLFSPIGPMLLRIIFFLCSLTAFAGDSTAYKRSLFFEAGGNGGVYTLGYERKLGRQESRKFNMCLGLAVLPTSGTSVTLAHTINVIVGKTKHKAEAGTGYMLAISLGGKGGTLRGTFRLGYRFEPPGKRYYLKFAYTPFYSVIYNFQWEHWGGIAFGYYLKKK
jgi:hypothetical protein